MNEHVLLQFGGAGDVQLHLCVVQIGKIHSVSKNQLALATVLQSGCSFLPALAHTSRKLTWNALLRKCCCEAVLNGMQAGCPQRLLVLVGLDGSGKAALANALVQGGWAHVNQVRPELDRCSRSCRQCHCWCLQPSSKAPRPATQKCDFQPSRSF